MIVFNGKLYRNTKTIHILLSYSRGYEMICPVRAVFDQILPFLIKTMFFKKYKK